MGYAHPALTPKQLALFMRKVHLAPKLRQLEQLVRDMNAVHEFARTVRYPARFLVMGSLGGRKMPTEIEERLERVRLFFEKWPITITPWQPGKRGWSGSYSLPRFSYGAKSIKSDFRYGGLVVWKAAEAHVLPAVRECLHCHSWFAARKTSHKFCSSNCQVSAFRTTGKGRAKRAEYMRRYRARLKRRDLENLRGAKVRR